MDYFFDTDVFIASLEPMVKIVRYLPSSLFEFAKEEVNKKRERMRMDEGQRAPLIEHRMTG